MQTSLFLVTVLCLEGANACTAPANTLLASFLFLFWILHAALAGIESAAAYVKRTCIELAVCGRAEEVSTRGVVTQ